MPHDPMTSFSYLLYCVKCNLRLMLLSSFLHQMCVHALVSLLVYARYSSRCLGDVHARLPRGGAGVAV